VSALVEGLAAGAVRDVDPAEPVGGDTDAELAQALAVARARAMHPAGSGRARPLRIVGTR
jgi:hypothetical protein